MLQEPIINFMDPCRKRFSLNLIYMFRIFAIKKNFKNLEANPQINLHAKHTFFS